MYTSRIVSLNFINIILKGKCGALGKQLFYAVTAFHVQVNKNYSQKISQDKI